MGFVMSSAAGWMSILLLLVAFLGCSTRVRVVATATATAAGSSNNSSSEDDPAITPATDCSMPETMVVSTSNCSYYDEQNMDGLIGGCRDFLTNIQNLPTKDCCTDVTYVAYTHTPCLCKAIFYPLDNSTVDSSSPSSTAVVNATRQKELPGLCLIKINFCTVCLDYLSSSSSQTASSSGSSAKSHKTRITVLKVLLPLVVVGVTIAVAAMLYRTHKARKAATAAAKQQQQQQTYVGSVPGGAF
ncbi:unnamed protein product [Sphagnum troendelagicum]|uniref:Bifunctional inhibitor/plant lipid transfer protein/seed storage helical domain-containing protein n=1 Tax=Sphagnum troendelagicum TaxID=128251 RepID=A0ABP0U325_9BRYO